MSEPTISRPEPVTPTPASGAAAAGPLREVLHEPLRRADRDRRRCGRRPPRRRARSRRRGRRPSSRSTRCRGRGAPGPRPARGRRRRRQAPDLDRAPSASGGQRGRARRAPPARKSAASARGASAGRRAAMTAQPSASRKSASSPVVPERHPAARRASARNFSRTRRERPTPPARMTVARPVRLHEHLHVLADRVEQAGQDRGRGPRPCWRGGSCRS